MNYYKDFYETANKIGFESFTSLFQESIKKAFHHGDWSKWSSILNNLPIISPSYIDLNRGHIQIGTIQDCDINTRIDLEKQLRKLSPWRKGPFNLFGIEINTEWRSDWKWDRLVNEIQPLDGKTILDIGCGNGYHLWRMHGINAETVIGIDPYLLYTIQFLAIKNYIGKKPVWNLPLSLEQMPKNLHTFDTVFSLGVLYHQKSPIDHLLNIKSMLKPNGELILETLIIDGKLGEILMPEDRYAQMRNVWFIPSTLTLELWLKKCGYKNIRLIDTTKTTIAEQHSTDWMQYKSLPDFLNKENNNFTLEGYPAPKRAIIIANYEQ